MTLIRWPEDTIARRFVAVNILTLVAILAMVLLFTKLGGVWSQEPLEESALPAQAGDTMRILEAAPVGIRKELAAAATTPHIHVDWYAADSAVAVALDTNHSRGVSNTARMISAQTHRLAVVFQPSNALSIPAPLISAGGTATPYILAMRLWDRSWLTLTAHKRLWGLSRLQHWAIRLVFVALSIALVSGMAARQFSNPVKRLAQAVRDFGLNPKAPPMVETGPKELRQVVATFNDMQAKIQRFVNYRTMMLAAISHDLRTPLTRIRLRGEFIEDEVQQAKLFRDVDEMQSMIEGALAFFRDDALAEETTTFDLSHVLLSIANDYADQEIAIEYTGPANAIYQGRPFAIKRAFTNLIENALKYGSTPAIELFCSDNSWVVAVKDRGPGIPPEALEAVFRPYYRVDKSRNRNTGGVGLGLSVVQAIVQGHGGEIYLTNRDGGGLEARVTLPRSAGLTNG